MGKLKIKYASVTETCPVCGVTFGINANAKESACDMGITCPTCGTVVYFEQDKNGQITQCGWCNGNMGMMY